MKKLTEKAAAVLLTAAIIITISGCKSVKSGGYTYDSAADFTPDEGEVFNSVPTGEYGGYTFHILNGKTGLPSSGIDTETITGATLNDAIYKRNRNVEARLNIKIEEKRDTPEIIFDTACKSVLADEDFYSAIWNTASYMGTMVAKGYLVSTDYLTELNLEKPWWNKSAISACSMSSLSFLLYGDIQLSYYDAHSMVGVNMEAMSKLSGADNPYTLVENGNWTYAKMLELMDMADLDVDGNGVMTSEDMYGAAVSDSCVLPLMFGCNTRMSEKDSYDLPVIGCINNEKFFDIFSLVSQSVFSRNPYIYNTITNPEDGLSELDMFKNKHSLFCFTTVGELEKLRNMDCEFGALPMPKYDTSQPDYISFLSANKASALGVPVTGRNFLRTGTILENLAAESDRSGGVRETYVDSVLAFRYVNDEKSRKNLETILSSGTFDLCDIYGWGGLSETVKDLSVNASDRFTSTVASIERNIDSDVSVTLDEIEKYR